MGEAQVKKVMEGSGEWMGCTIGGLHITFDSCNACTAVGYVKCSKPNFLFS